MKTILVPTDFSDCATNAYLYACRLAEKLHAKIILTHVFHVPVIDPNIPADLTEDMISEKRMNSLEQFKKINQKMAGIIGEDQFGKIKTENLLRQGFAVSEIEELSREIAPDLIIMGTQGASGLKKLIGSNTSNIVQRSHVPVLVVPSEARFSGIGHILYATELGSEEFKAINQLLDFAKIFGAGITCLHVYKDNELPDEARMADLKQYFHNDLKMHYIQLEFVHNNDIAEGIHQFLEMHDCELLAMQTHHRNFFNKLFHKSLTRKMAFHTDKPLLAFHN